MKNNSTSTTRLNYLLYPLCSIITITGFEPASSAPFETTYNESPFMNSSDRSSLFFLGRPLTPLYGSAMKVRALLYRSRLSAPLDALEVIFSVSRLPSGPGAAVLGWTTLLLAVVFMGGFLAIYRLGMGQIRLARQQQDFVSAVSHELKTPLTSIRMYGEMLREGWADDTRRQQYYEYIHDESERLTRLIDNVLRLSSITRNGPSFDLRPSTAGELMGQLRSKIASQVERAGFELSFSIDEGAKRAEVLIDEDCFVQILINLVDNAIKFSKKAGADRVDIGAVIDGRRQLRFSVRDYGPGVPRDQMKKIFKLFYRSENELTRETVGTGIGLALVIEGRRGGPTSDGLGLIGAAVINLCGGAALVYWLIWGDLNLPLRGRHVGVSRPDDRRDRPAHLGPARRRDRRAGRAWSFWL